MNGRLAAVSMFAVLTAAGCNKQPSDTHAMLRTDSGSCVAEAYMLELPKAGRFVLNSETRDSAGIVNWIANVLPKRSGDGRMVNIRVALPDRRTDLAWVVREIENAGGKPYAYDPSCQIEIPTQRAG